MSEIDREYLNTHCWVCGRTNEELIPFFGKEATLREVEYTSDWGGIYLCGVCNDVMLGLAVKYELVSVYELREMVDTTILKYVASITGMIDRQYTEPISMRTIRDEMKKNAEDEEEYVDTAVEELLMPEDELVLPEEE